MLPREAATIATIVKDYKTLSPNLGLNSWVAFTSAIHEPALLTGEFLLRAAERVYVGCGDDETTGAIAMIDATTNQRLPDDYKLGGEPESFQLETTETDSRIST